MALTESTLLEMTRGNTGFVTLYFRHKNVDIILLKLSTSVKYTNIGISTVSGITLVHHIFIPSV